MWCSARAGHLCLSQSVSVAARVRSGLSRDAGVEARRCWPKRRSPLPGNLTFVPLDFEHKTLADGSGRGGIRLCRRRRSSAGWAWFRTSRWRLFGPRWRRSRNARGQRRGLRLRAFAGDAEPCGRMAFDALAERVRRPASRFNCSSRQKNWKRSCAAPGFIALSRSTTEQTQRALLPRTAPTA